MLDLIHAFNLLLSVAVTAAFAYQGAFMLVGFLNRRRAEQYDAPPARELRRYAALIAARNEEAVIAELIESLRAQDYPADKLDIFVVADNCTDATAAADYAALLDTLAARLGANRAVHFHAHFSRIAYTKGGEKCHLTFADTAFGPPHAPLLALLKERHLAPTIICESAGTQAEDAAALAQGYAAL